MQENVLTVDERIELRNILAGLYEFQQGPLAHTQFVQLAGLSRFVGAIQVGFNAQSAAGALILALEKFGPLPERKGYHALGSLLSYMLTIAELGTSQKKTVAELIVKYSLVDDVNYIRKLKEDYSITTPSVRQPETSLPAPSARLTMPEPPIEAEMSEEDAEGLERIINSEDNLLDIYLLYGAIYCAQAVCRVELPNGTLGTGCLIGPRLVLTNHHVIPKKQYLEKAIARFDYAIDKTGVAAPGRPFKIQPDFYFSSPAEELDYALVQLESSPIEQIAMPQEAAAMSMIELIRAGKHRGYLTLSPDLILKHQRVNIIQHPDGKPQKVALTQNYVIADMSETRVHYLADTMPGSSGAPVFNDKWEVVALHHSGEPYPPQSLSQTVKKALKGNLQYNEGVPVRAFYKTILPHLPQS